MPNSSPTLWATTVSGLLRQNGENIVTMSSPVGPSESPTLSGTLVRPAASYQNQNSVGPYDVGRLELAGGHRPELGTLRISARPCRTPVPSGQPARHRDHPFR